MQTENNVYHISSVLSNEGIMLVPADGIWGIACSIDNASGINKITGIKHNNDRFHFEILVSDIGMLKKYVHQLHPRIETLLVYHERPLKIFFPHFKALPEQVSRLNPLYFRMVKDPLMKDLIGNLNQPLFICSFLDESTKFSLPFAQIDLHRLPSPDLIVPSSMNSDHYEENIPVLRISFDDEGLVTILE